MEKEECYFCDNKLDEYEMENPYRDEDENILCDNCYTEQYQNFCPLCEEYYDKPTKPEECFFVVAKEVKDDVACNPIKPGIYQTTSWPYWLGATGFGFEMLFEDSIKLIRELDINSMIQKLYPHSDMIGADEICPCCVEKYTNLKFKKRTDYVDDFYRLHYNIYERGVISNGF
jgi:hypothetical protein